jgi:rubrerythrin
MKKKLKWFLGRSADELDAEGPKTVTKRVEVVHLRRVVKRGEKAVRHRSETLERDAVSERDLEITRNVVENVSRPVAPAPVDASAQTVPKFRCFECGTLMPADAVRCPKCDVLYVRDLADVAVDEATAEKDSLPLEGGEADLLQEGETSFVHFCPVRGEVTCLENDEGESDFGLECQGCGTVTQLGVDRCPICGCDFEEEDAGLLHLLEGLKFDLDDDKELDCPSCGEHVVAKDARCPSCGEPICFRFARSKEAAVLPVLKERDILFVHLDVMSGDLHFAKKVRFKRTSTVQSVHLDSMTKSAFEHDWQSIARI